MLAAVCLWIEFDIRFILPRHRLSAHYFFFLIHQQCVHASIPCTHPSIPCSQCTDSLVVFLSFFLAGNFVHVVVFCCHALPDLMMMNIYSASNFPFLLRLAVTSFPRCHACPVIINTVTAFLFSEHYYLHRRLLFLRDLNRFVAGI